MMTMRKKITVISVAVILLIVVATFLVSDNVLFKGKFDLSRLTKRSGPQEMISDPAHNFLIDNYIELFKQNKYDEAFQTLSLFSEGLRFMTSRSIKTNVEPYLLKKLQGAFSLAENGTSYKEIQALINPSLIVFDLLYINTDSEIYSLLLTKKQILQNAASTYPFEWPLVALSPEGTGLIARNVKCDREGNCISFIKTFLEEFLEPRNFVDCAMGDRIADSTFVCPNGIQCTGDRTGGIFENEFDDQGKIFQVDVTRNFVNQLGANGTDIINHQCRGGGGGGGGIASGFGSEYCVLGMTSHRERMARGGGGLRGDIARAGECMRKFRDGASTVNTPLCTQSDGDDTPASSSSANAQNERPLNSEEKEIYDDTKNDSQQELQQAVQDIAGVSPEKAAEAVKSLENVKTSISSSACGGYGACTFVDQNGQVNIAFNSNAEARGGVNVMSASHELIHAALVGAGMPISQQNNTATHKSIYKKSVDILFTIVNKRSGGLSDDTCDAVGERHRKTMICMREAIYGESSLPSTQETLRDPHDPLVLRENYTSSPLASECGKTYIAKLLTDRCKQLTLCEDNNCCRGNFSGFSSSSSMKFCFLSDPPPPVCLSESPSVPHLPRPSPAPEKSGKQIPLLKKSIVK